jgi:hypothetical protein
MEEPEPNIPEAAEFMQSQVKHQASTALEKTRTKIQADQNQSPY